MLRIRPFRVEDERALAAFWIGGWTALFPEIDFSARWPVMLARWHDVTQRGGSFDVIDRDGLAVGFCVVETGRHYLDQIAVAPGEQGRGTATILLDRAKARSTERLDLHVNLGNPRAIRFYEREGFMRAGEATNPNSGLPTAMYRWRRATTAPLA